ncbi:MAG TPA: cell division protein FtsL [Nitrospirota bacterium]
MSIYTSNYLSGLRYRKLRYIRRAGGLLFGIMVCSFLVLYVWQRVNVIRVGYEVEELKKEKAELSKSREMLNIEAATLTSPDRVERIATASLGMKVPEECQVVLVKRVGAGGGNVADPAKQARKSAAWPGRS